MDLSPTSYKSMVRKLEVLKERAEQLESAAAKPPERWWVPSACPPRARSQDRPPLFRSNLEPDAPADIHSPPTLAIPTNPRSRQPKSSPS